MRALNCIVLVFSVYIASNFANGSPFPQQRPAEQPGDAQSNPLHFPKNFFQRDDFFSVSKDLIQKTEQRIAQLEQSVINNFKQNLSPVEPNIGEMQNRTTKEIKIFGDKIVETEERVVSIGDKNNGTIAIYKIIKFRPRDDAQPSTPRPVESVDQVPTADKTVPTPNKTPTPEVQTAKTEQTSNDPARTIEQYPANEQKTQKPDVHDKEDTIPLEVANEIDIVEVAPHDLSQDTRVNDLASQRAGLISIDPDVELIEIDGNHPQAKYYYSHNQIDESLPKDLSTDTRVNDRIHEQETLSGLSKVDPDAELIDIKKPDQEPQHSHIRAQISKQNEDIETFKTANAIDQQPAADLIRENTDSHTDRVIDLSGDISVNNRVAEKIKAGIIKPDPDAEIIENRNQNYYVPSTNLRLRVADLSRDTVVNERIAEQQAASGLVMIDPDAELIDDKLNKNYYQVDNRMIQPRDLRRNLYVDDYISKRRNSGSVNIDPEVEYINTNANNRNVMYSYIPYVPNYIQQTVRRKRVPARHWYYQERVYQQPQIVFRDW